MIFISETCLEINYGLSQRKHEVKKNTTRD